jgi:hypothetical protein
VSLQISIGDDEMMSLGEADAHACVQAFLSLNRPDRASIIFTPGKMLHLVK